MTTMKAARQKHRRLMHGTKLVERMDPDGETVRKVEVPDTSKMRSDYVSFRAWARANASTFTEPLSPKLKEIVK